MKRSYLSLFFLSVLLSACGGGGGGSYSGNAAPPPLSSVNPANKAAADAVISSLALAQEGLTLRGIPVPGLSSFKPSSKASLLSEKSSDQLSDVSKIRQALGKDQSTLESNLGSITRAPGDGTFLGPAGTFFFEDLTFNTFSALGEVPGSACGSITIGFGDDPGLRTDDFFTLVMTGCGDPSDPSAFNPAPSFAWGTIDGRATPDGTGFQLTYTDFNWNNHLAQRVDSGGTANVTITGENTDSNTDGGGSGQQTETDICSGGGSGGCSETSNTNLVISYTETIRNGTIIFPIGTYDCAAANAVSNREGIYNISGSDRLNVDGNKFEQMEIDESFVNNFTILLSESQAPDCVVTFTINGRREFTDNLNPEKSFVADYDNVQLSIARTSRTINGIPTLGDDVIQSGTVTITAPCSNGTFTLSTEAGNPFFVPDGSKCAVLGKHLVTDTVNNIVTAVMATPAGGIDVDRGNDGSVEQTFVDCRDAIICTD